ncbi:MAG: hypothetical protein QM660_12700 [Dysgonomonas sp.]
MKLSKGNKFQQVITMLLTSLFWILSLGMFIIDISVVTIIIFLLVTFIVLGINIIQSRCYNISISSSDICLENIYKNTVISTSLFESITCTKFKFILPLFYRSPPFFYINLKDGRKFLFEYNTSKLTKYYISYLNPFGGKKIEKELNERIKLIIRDENK